MDIEIRNNGRENIDNYQLGSQKEFYIYFILAKLKIF